MTDAGATQSEQKSTPLTKAIELSNQFWFPGSPEAFSRLKKSVWGADSQRLPVEVVTSTTRDLSLFMYCIRELNRLIDTGAITSISEISDPLLTLSELSQSQWKLIIPITMASTSSHALAGSNEAQKDRIHGALFSATCAELIADSYEVDPTVAFSCAFLRQLGYTLIAYNYPRIYQRALTARPKNEGFERALSRALGFSPTMLGAAVAESWRLSLDLKGAMAPRGEPQPGEELSTLSKLCRVGELLAMAERRNSYPEAKGSWEEARQHVEAVLGPLALELISCRLTDYIKPLAIPFSAPIPTAPVQLEPSPLDQPDKTPPLIAERLKEIHRLFEATGSSREPIEALSQLVVGEAGFARGCVFLAEIDSGILMPRFRMGNEGGFEDGAAERRTPEFRERSYDKTSESADPIVSAFKKCEVAKSDDILIGDHLVTYFTGPVGSTPCLGVLYLEIDSSVCSATDGESAFRAILQTFIDVLDLK